MKKFWIILFNWWRGPENWWHHENFHHWTVITVWKIAEFKKIHETWFQISLDPSADKYFKNQNEINHQGQLVLVRGSVIGIMYQLIRLVRIMFWWETWPIYRDATRFKLWVEIGIAVQVFGWKSMYPCNFRGSMRYYPFFWDSVPFSDKTKGFKSIEYYDEYIALSWCSLTDGSVTQGSLC